jgi:hypothetical protein
MRFTPKIRGLVLAAILLGCGSLALKAGAAPEVDDMTQAATRFLAALHSDQRTKAAYEFGADERMNWHFVPRERNGLPIKEMEPSQRTLAYALLSSALSHRSYLKAMTIMSLEQILKDVEQGKGPVRDSERYFFTIFGQPGKGDWGWRVEGHHLSVNFTISADGNVAATPFFFGSNPDIVKEGPRSGLHILAEEEDVARGLVKTLTPDQREKAVFATDAPGEIITSDARKVNPLEWKGISASDLSSEQKDGLAALIKVYIERTRPELAAKDWQRIEKAGLDKVKFAWAGGIEPGQKHYYRVQGPTFLLEYDNTQNDANHIHAVWRDFANDFGADLLRLHYDRDHQTK